MASHPHRFHLLLTLLLLLLPSLTLGCVSNWDCSLGGVCNRTTSLCDCDVWWTGPQCQHLHLQPASRLNGFNLAVNTSTWHALTSPQPTHSWCISARHDPSSGDYVAVVSYLLLHCTLDAWTTNSQVVTVRSPNPYGPFNPSSIAVAVPVFAHNPKLTRAPDGTWLLFFVGDPSSHSPPLNCTSSSSPTPFPSLAADAVDVWNNGSRVAISNSSRGPWTLWKGGEPLFTPNASRWYSRTVTNPAPLILPNGTTLLYFTGAPDTTRGPHTGNVIAVARARHWSGPYEVMDLKGGMTTPDGEDPVVWRDVRGRYHLLLNTNTGHWMDGNLTGAYTGHAWSEDGVTWSEQFLGAVTTTVHFDDGSMVEFSYRERPDVVLDDRGRPIALATGMTGVDGYGDSFSFVQPICTCETPTQLCYGGTEKPAPCGARRHASSSAVSDD